MRDLPIYPNEKVPFSEYEKVYQILFAINQMYPKDCYIVKMLEIIKPAIANNRPNRSME